MKLSNFFVWCLLITTLTSLPLGADAKKKKSKKTKTKRAEPEPEPASVGITQQEYCDGCITTVEQFHFEITDQYAKEMEARRKGKRTDTLQAIPMLVEMCEGPRFKDFKDGIKFSCRKLAQENAEQLVTPFAGQKRGGEDKQLSRVQEVKQVCLDVGACLPNSLHSVMERKPCAACKALTMDMEMLLRREARVPDHADSVLLLHSVCSDAAMRHPSPAYVESYCEEWTDEMEDTLSRVLSLRQRMLNSGLKPSQTLEQAVCGPDLLDVCEDEVQDEGVTLKWDDHMEL